jgi:hypothetical protein
MKPSPVISTVSALSQRQARLQLGLRLLSHLARVLGFWPCAVQAEVPMRRDFREIERGACRRSRGGSSAATRSIGGLFNQEYGILKDRPGRLNLYQVIRPDRHALWTGFHLEQTRVHWPHSFWIDHEN